MTNIEFWKLKDEVILLLKKKLKPKRTYHSVEHTLDVLTQAEIIGRKEKFTRKEMGLLKIAALFHDTGFMNGKDISEEMSCVIAKRILSKYNLPEGDIEIVCNAIMSTKLPQTPTDKISAVLCDADLDYLGRNDFEEVSQKLYDELKAFKKIKNKDEWNKLQVQFFKQHHYHTAAGKKMRDKKKAVHLSELKKLIK